MKITVINGQNHKGSNYRAGRILGTHALTGKYAANLYLIGFQR